MIRKIESFCSSYLNGITGIKTHATQSYGKTALAALKIFTYIASLAVLPIVALTTRYICRKISSPVIPIPRPGHSSEVTSKEEMDKYFNHRQALVNAQEILKRVELYHKGQECEGVFSFKISGNQVDVCLSTLKAHDINNKPTIDLNSLHYFKGKCIDNLTIIISLDTLALGHTLTLYSDDSKPVPTMKKPWVSSLIKELNNITSPITFTLKNKKTYTLSFVTAYNSLRKQETDFELPSNVRLVSYFKGLDEQNNTVEISVTDIENVEYSKTT